LSLCDKPSKYTRLQCHILGWTDNPSTLRWNVTVVNCHSRRFVGWTLHLGRNVAWSVCRWMDRLDTSSATKGWPSNTTGWPSATKRWSSKTAGWSSAHPGWSFRITGWYSATTGWFSKLQYIPLQLQDIPQQPQIAPQKTTG
jgi:hypothetical protein